MTDISAASNHGETFIRSRECAGAKLGSEVSKWGDATCDNDTDADNLLSVSTRNWADGHEPSTRQQITADTYTSATGQLKILDKTAHCTTRPTAVARTLSFVVTGWALGLLKAPARGGQAFGYHATANDNSNKMSAKSNSFWSKNKKKQQN